MTSDQKRRTFKSAKESETPPPWIGAATGGSIGTVGSTTLVREFNERSLLDLLRSEGPLSRVELANRTGLSKPTVSTALANLVRCGLVMEDGAETGKRGPAAVIYRARAAIGFVMSLDIGRSWIRSMVADLAGSVIARSDVPNRARSASALLALITKLAAEVQTEAAHMVWGNRSQPLNVIVTVIGGPGAIDEATLSIKVSGEIRGWGKTGFVAELRSQLSGQVIIENDINLAAVGEHANGIAVGIENFVLLSIGTGVGCGIVLNDALFRGSSGSAGEFGFAPISPGNQLAPIRAASQDRATGVLEEKLGASSIVARAHSLGLDAVTDARTLFELASSGSAPAKGVLAEVGELLGRAIVTVVSLFDPEIIVIAGGIGGSLEQLRPDLDAAVARLSPFKPTIVAGRLGEAAVLHGGVAVGLPIARNRIFADRESAQHYI